MDFLNRFRIPTIFGLTVILLGLGVGVFLVLQNQTITTKAAPDKTPKNIVISNVIDTSASASWQTQTPTAAFVSLENLTGGGGTTILDDQDPTIPAPHTLHHVTFSNLNPNLSYSFKIISGKTVSSDIKFKTASISDTQNGFKPIIGAVTDDKGPLSSGLVYLNIDGASVQSAVIKSSGNFIVPISQMRKSDLSSVFMPNGEQIVKISVFSEDGKTGSVSIRLKDTENPISLKVGENLDLTKNSNTLGVNSAQFDLNGDGLVNSSDYGILLKNFGRNPKNPKADLNQDGAVDNKDLKLMQEALNKFSK